MEIKKKSKVRDMYVCVNSADPDQTGLKGAV